MLPSYPETARERDAWIVARRPPRNAVDPTRPYACFVEDERSATGEIVPVATIFLTNRECPWRCLMCDLWRNTLPETVPVGSIPTQIEFALQQIAPAREIKLYNSGSFFDVRAIPNEDHAAIASQVAGFDRVIVECHPALVGDDCRQFKDRLDGRLEVAMGLETAHPDILARLNKRMTVEQFAAASGFLRLEGIDLRVFILVKPPFMIDGEVLEWANRSLDFAFDCGATAATLIPTRGGNGALEELASTGNFSPPRLHMLESAMAYGLSLGHGRVFVDLWDAPSTGTCTQCFEKRVARLRAMNLQQSILPPISCENCEVER